MLANFFDKTKPFNSIILGLIFSIVYFIHVYALEIADSIDYYWLKADVFFLINLLFLILSSYLFIKNGVSNNNLHNTFVILLFYCMFQNAFDARQILFVTILFLFIYRDLASLKTSGNKQLALFNVGFFTGISFLIYNWSILFLGFIFISMILAKKIQLKNILGTLLGTLAPIFLCFTYYFITDNTQIFIDKFGFSYSLNFEAYTQPYIKTQLIAVLFIVSLSLFSVLSKILSTSGPYHYQYSLAAFMLLTGFFILIMIPIKDGSELLLIFVPSAILIGRFLKLITNLVFKEVFFLVFTIFSFVVYLQNL